MAQQLIQTRHIEERKSIPPGINQVRTVYQIVKQET